MHIRLLGGIEVTTETGEAVDVGPSKCQTLLAALALSPGAAVPVPRLVELVWADDPPRTAEKTLQSYVARLRRGLGPASIERVGAAYRLAIDPAAVDVTRFEQRLTRGEVASALDEWAGAPFAGLNAPGLGPAAESLTEQWLGALEADFERRVESDPADSVAALTELTARHPFREGLWALLMTALYRSGRQADALAAYRRARRHLVDELGIEPGPRLRELEVLVLGQDDRLEPSPAPAGIPPTGTVTFAFCDIQGSSELWATHRADMARAVARHDEIVRSVTSAHDGFVFAAGGDSFGVAFHRARDAARWAGSLQIAIGEEAWPLGIELRVRVGLNSGEAEERGNNYFGPPVNVAARVAAAAHGGQVVMSQVTAALLDDFELVELGEFRLDGVPSNVTILQLGAGQFPALRTEHGHRGNLPRRTGRLFGREDTLEELGQALSDAPVVTLVGPGGIGKSTLAVAAARRSEVNRSGGAWLVELADVGASSEVVRAVADVLDVTEGAGRTVQAALMAHLERRSLLLVLDNCEHVIEGASALAGAIAQACPGVGMLATSREGLGVAGERLVAVGPLVPREAGVELFEDRAVAVDPSFDLDVERAAVEEICERLDGVPLAIELAAARVRSLAPRDMVERLDDRLRLLGGGRRRSVERHRTLRAAIQWSYDLLTPAEQALFRRLSIFAGSFDLRAAEAVVADEDLRIDEIDRLLSGLVERSMVEVSSGPFGRTFRLLETIRQFASEHLGEEGTTERLAAGHASYVLAEVRHLGALLLSNDEVAAAARLAVLWPNLRAAVDWALFVQDRELSFELLRPIALQVFVRRGLGEIVDWVERLLDITPREDEDVVAFGLLWAALHYSMTQQRDEYRSLLERHGSPDLLLVHYAYLVIEDDDHAALELGPKLIAEMNQRGEDGYALLFEMFLGGALLAAGRTEESQACHLALVERFRQHGPPTYLNWTYYLLGAAAVFEGDHERADLYWDHATAIDVPPRTNSPNDVLSARAAFRRGRHREAFRVLLDYLDELDEDDNMSGVAMAGIEFVNMTVGVGRLDDAATILGHFDATGLLGVEGPGFKLLVTDAVEVVSADPHALATQTRIAQLGMDEHAALRFMRVALEDLLAVHSRP